MLRALFTLPRRRLVFKITGVSVLLVALTISYFGWENYHRERWLMQARFGKAMQRVVQVAALSLDGADHLLMAQGDEAARSRLADYLRRIEQTSELGPGALFTVFVDDPQAVLAQPEDAPITLRRGVPGGPPVRFHVNANRAIRRAIEGQTSSYSALFEVEGGEEISAFAALGPEGQVVALLVANHDLTEIAEARAAIQSRVVITSSAAILLATLASGLLALGIGRALQRIRAGAKAIKDQDYDHRITVRRSDELGLVAEQFNEMAATLAQRVQLLKYLPAYTLEAIVRRSRAEHSEIDAIESMSGTVLFTDIRGYTSMAEGIGPEGIVAVLNTYLRRQAELMAEHDGVIDKFIGDAVLGVFLGDDHVRRAVECALAIQRAVVQMNADGLFEFPVYVGIGVATGELVLAEIGSDDRRERSLIGSVVNLAARLCGRALANEVVVGDQVRAVMGKGLVVSKSEQAELKGFASPQGCHTVVGVAKL